MGTGIVADVRTVCPVVHKDTALGVTTSRVKSEAW